MCNVKKNKKIMQYVCHICFYLFLFTFYHEIFLLLYTFLFRIHYVKNFFLFKVLNYK